MINFTTEELTAIRNLVEVGLRGMKIEWRDSIQYTSIKDEMTKDIEFVEKLLEKITLEVPKPKFF